VTSDDALFKSSEWIRGKATRKRLKNVFIDSQYISHHWGESVQQFSFFFFGILAFDEMQLVKDKK
jgi:hypothetical protein